MFVKKRKIDCFSDDGFSDRLVNGLGNGNVSKIEIGDIFKKVKKVKYELDVKGEEKKKFKCEVEKDEGVEIFVEKKLGFG